MGSTCTCKEGMKATEAILPTKNDIIEEIDSVKNTINKESPLFALYEDTDYKDKLYLLVSLIQATYRSFKMRQKITKLRSKNKKINFISPKKHNDQCFDWYKLEINNKALNALKIQIRDFYKNFFNLTQVDISQILNTGEVNLRYSSLDFKSGEAFELNNKSIILLYMKKNTSFNMDFLTKNKSAIVNNFSPNYSDKIKSFTSSKKGSIINLSNYNNNIQGQKENFENKLATSNNSSIQQLVLKNKIPNKSYNQLIEPFDSEEIVKISTERKGLIPIFYDDEVSNPSESFGRSYMEFILFQIEQRKESCKQVVLNDELTKSFYEGSMDKVTKTKCGLGLCRSSNEKNGKKFKYYGYFYNNEFHGIGIYLREDGYVYKGEFRNGKKCGFGIETQSDKYAYKGFFYDDKFNGFGVYNRLDKKAIYHGNFSNNQKEGLGYIKFNDESFYSGTFKNNKREGKGLIKWSEGQSFFGGWINDKMNGNGIFHFKNGDLFKGNFENDIKNGEGIYYYKNGASLQGNWINGKKEGSFIYMKKGIKMTEVYRNDNHI